MLWNREYMYIYDYETAVKQKLEAVCYLKMIAQAVTMEVNSLRTGDAYKNKELGHFTASISRSPNDTKPLPKP